ncbi:hypothetical protein, partial [Acinetobacter baumannii]|uniref:hypothetical protein n=1 Tax=Acinetobacter baumannii TaxID=470 RepID=UPI0027D0E6DD
KFDGLYSFFSNENIHKAVLDFINTLDDNFENSDNVNSELASLFVANFFLSIFEFLKTLKNIVKFDNTLHVSYIDFIESDYFNEIYDYTQEFYNKTKIEKNHAGKDGYSRALFLIDYKISTLDEKVENLGNQFNIINSDYLLHKQNNFEEQRKIFENNAQEIYLLYQNDLNNLTKKFENELEPEVHDLKVRLDNNRAELGSLLDDVKLYQDKMTNKAVAEMSAHYYDKSQFEKYSYFIVTFVSAAIITASVVIAYMGVDSYYDQYVSTKLCDNLDNSKEKDSTKEKDLSTVKVKSYEECMKDLTVKREATQKNAFNYLIFRLSFSLLLFLAVIYASRIAMRAYKHWRQSENMYLKLNTLSPFIGSLDKSVRNDVHLSLVPDYFGKDAGMVESSKDTVKDLPTNISNIAIKAIEQAGSTIGSKLGSNKETKNSDSESSTEKNKKKSEDESQ